MNICWLFSSSTEWKVSTFMDSIYEPWNMNIFLTRSVWPYPWNNCTVICVCWEVGGNSITISINSCQVIVRVASFTLIMPSSVGGTTYPPSPSLPNLGQQKLEDRMLSWSCCSSHSFKVFIPLNNVPLWILQNNLSVGSRSTQCAARCLKQRRFSLGFSTAKFTLHTQPWSCKALTWIFCYRLRAQWLEAFEYFESLNWVMQTALRNVESLLQFGVRECKIILQLHFEAISTFEGMGHAFDIKKSRSCNMGCY